MSRNAGTTFVQIRTPFTMLKTWQPVKTFSVYGWGIFGQVK